MELSFLATGILCFFVFLAGFIDAAAGGGGLISLPAYLIVGLPAHFAIGCNKFSATSGTTFSAIRFFKHGAVSKKIATISAVFAFVSSYFGMKLALSINQNILKTALIVALPFLAIILFLKQDFGSVDTSLNMSNKKAGLLAASVGCGIGFYDGLIGPGTGTFAIIAYSALMNFDLKTASGNSKILNLASGYASVIAAITSGKVIYKIAIPAAVFGILGNFLGSGLAIKKGSKFIRPLILFVILLLCLKLIYDIFSVGRSL
ncbi:MAG: hypothetical protein CR988_01315 [Treponema sp.]|nr:MAG: hypothetical protein CR988_01315 [Treponema sp.]